MGEKFDVGVFIDHDFEFNTADELVEKFKKKLNTDVFVEVYDYDPENRNTAPLNYKGWATERLFSQTLNEELEENGDMDFYLNVDGPRVLISIFKKVIEISIDEILNNFKDSRETISMFIYLSKLTPAQLASHPYQRVRINTYEWIKKFGGKNLILFRVKKTWIYTKTFLMAYHLMKYS